MARWWREAAPRATPRQRSTPRARTAPVPDVLWSRSSSRLSEAAAAREAAWRADLYNVALTPTGSPRIIQGGSKAYDRWRLQRDKKRDRKEIDAAKSATDVFTPPAGIEYGYLVKFNPKREQEREHIDVGEPARARVAHREQPEHAHGDARVR